MKSWLDIPEDSDFSIYNLPYGVFTTDTRPNPRIGVAIGNHIFDLQEAALRGLFTSLTVNVEVFLQTTLNLLAASGKQSWSLIRSRIQDALSEGSMYKEVIERFCLVNQKDAVLYKPVQIAEYTDFYSSEAHATNVGKMFRDPANALLPNWKHLPVAYHGRKSSIFISGTPFHRPKGQIKLSEAEPPVLAPTRKLDFELEMAAIIGVPSSIGESISTADAEDYVFGFVMFNDWSARDIQRWEYQPLGPFLSKNFFSSMSGWVVTLDALEPFRIAGPAQDPPVLPYLQYEGPRHFDVRLEVAIQPAGGVETIVCRTNFQNLYWNIAQQIAHHTVNGCNLNTGDLLASGTISGFESGSFGSLLEITEGGKTPVVLTGGAERTFLEDGDTALFRAYAQKGDVRVGFGELKNQVLPAKR